MRRDQVAGDLRLQKARTFLLFLYLLILYLISEL